MISMNKKIVDLIARPKTWRKAYQRKAKFWCNGTNINIIFYNVKNALKLSLSVQFLACFSTSLGLLLYS
jgi:hypothetical protein